MTVKKKEVSSPTTAGNIHQNEEDHLLVEPEAPPIAVAVPVIAFPVNAVPVVAHDSLQYTNGAFVVGKNGSSSNNFVEADSMPRLVPSVRYFLYYHTFVIIKLLPFQVAL